MRSEQVASSKHLSLVNIQEPPCRPRLPHGLACINPTSRASIPSDELIEGHLRAYLSATPRGQSSSHSFLLLSPSRTRSPIKKKRCPSAFRALSTSPLQLLELAASSSLFTCARLRIAYDTVINRHTCAVLQTLALS